MNRLLTAGALAMASAYGRPSRPMTARGPWAYQTRPASKRDLKLEWKRTHTHRERVEAHRARKVARR